MSLALNYQNRNSFSKLNPKATFDNDTVSGHLFMINAVVLGYSRFSHMDMLCLDKVFCDIMNDKVPSEKVCRDLLLSLPKKTVTQLRRANKKALEVQASTEAPREIMLNFDDTVVTVFGSQEGSGIGYNPRYKGRASFKEKIGVIAGTDEVLNVTLENGRNHLNQ